MILAEVLAEQLRKLNRIQFKGQEYHFSEANIQSAMRALKDVLFVGLVRTNEKIYDLLVLGKSLQQACGALMGITTRLDLPGHLNRIIELGLTSIHPGTGL